MATLTELLEHTIDRLKNLPTGEQDAVAALILEELEADRRWDEALARSPKVLS